MAKTTLQSIPVSIGQEIDLDIYSMAYDNSAVGRYENFVVMVDRGAPGDSIKASVTSLRPNYARGKIVEIKKSNPDYRIAPPCKVYKVCGGCQWQHLPYEKQLEQKDFLIQQFFLKLNLEKDIIKKIIGVENPWNYRNKVQYPVRTVPSTKRLKAGYFEWHSNELVNIKFCPIQYSLFDQIVETVRELSDKYKIISYNSKDKTGWLRHICIRAGNLNGKYEAILTLVATNENLSGAQEFAKEVISKHSEIVGVCINVNKNTTNVIYGEKTFAIKGRGYIFETIGGLKFKISASSFFQINSAQTLKLLEIIENFADINPDETVLDAYCGVGLITLHLAKHSKKVIGIEEIRQSIDDAVFNTKENNIKNIKFVNGKVENKLKSIIELEKPEVIVLDPPRAGCNKKILENILASNNVKKIIYVSCNPATLLRDLEILSRDTFSVKTIQPIDMFPHSYHVECVVLLERS